MKQQDNAISIISVGVTFVDGRIFLNHTKHQSKAYYGICHFSKRIAFITPLDYPQPSFITQVLVDPTVGYCSRSHMCLYFDCPLNKFRKDSFLSEFIGFGEFTAGLPKNIGTKPLWFNDPGFKNGKYIKFWEKMMMPIDGGILRFRESIESKL
jgi:hypothetical protein